MSQNGTRGKKRELFTHIMERGAIAGSFVESLHTILRWLVVSSKTGEHNRHVAGSLSRRILRYKHVIISLYE